MKAAIMQPYFLPYIGYFQLINTADVFVVYDDVNYIKQGWINRNRILLNGAAYMFTLNLKGASSFKLINGIEIGGNKERLFKTISQAYAKAPFYNDAIGLLDGIFGSSEKNLAYFIADSIKVISRHLNIGAEIILSSKIEKNNDLKADKKVINICKILGATHYVNSIGGEKLYSKKSFLDAGINLEFIRSKPISYRQFNNGFVEWLSIVDVMMFNPVEAVREMLDQYELI